MKNLISILIILFVLFVSFKRSESIRYINNKRKINPSLITVTRKKLQCVSSLQHKTDKWTKLHVKSLNLGFNFFGFVSREGQRIEIKIWNY